MPRNEGFSINLTDFSKINKPEPVRLLSHAYFAALNGVLITFRNYPGRTTKAVRQHMLNVARVIAQSFSNTQTK